MNESCTHWFAKLSPQQVERKRQQQEAAAETLKTTKGLSAYPFAPNAPHLTVARPSDLFSDLPQNLTWEEFYAARRLDISSGNFELIHPEVTCRGLSTPSDLSAARERPGSLMQNSSDSASDPAPNPFAPFNNASTASSTANTTSTITTPANPTTTTTTTTSNMNDTSPPNSSDEEEQFFGYALLRFPDAVYVMKSLYVVIGRDKTAFNEISILEQVRNMVIENADANMMSDETIISESDIQKTVSTTPEAQNEQVANISFSQENTPTQATMEDITGGETDEELLQKVPFLAIHQPKRANMPFNSGVNISRVHALLSYNAQDYRFEITVRGRNGLFINDEHFSQSSVIDLRHADQVRIGDVQFEFELPDEEPESTSGNISYTFESGYVSGQSDEDDANPVFRLGSGNLNSHDDDDDNDNDDILADEDEEENQRPKARIKLSMNKSQSSTLKNKGKASNPISNSISKQDSATDPNSKNKNKERVARDLPLVNGDNVNIAELPPGAIIPARKKGPGRPPKDGIMSKREKQAIMKAAKERERKIQQGQDPGPLIMTEASRRPNRPKNDDKGDQSDADDDENDNGEKHNDKTHKQGLSTPKTPPPEKKESDYTEEELAKPVETYAQMLWSILSDEPGNKMNLQAIYKAFHDKYPYFKFKCDTPGWQSSVRHNLGSNKSFLKAEKDGKGYFWTLNPAHPVNPKKANERPPQTYIPNQMNNGLGGPSSNYSSQMLAGQQMMTSQMTHHMPSQRPTYGQNTQSNNLNAGLPRSLGNGHPTATYGASVNGSRPPGSVSQIPPASRTHVGQSNGTVAHSSLSPLNNGANVPRQQNYTSTYTNNPGRGYWSSQPQPAYQSGPALSTRAIPARTSTPRPSEEIVNVFKNVFKKSIGSGMDERTAENIVDNAVKRVLDPESMINVPLLEREQPVIEAFRSCIEKSIQPSRPGLATAPTNSSNQGSSTPQPPNASSSSNSSNTQTVLGTGTSLTPSPAVQTASTVAAATSAAVAITQTQNQKKEELQKQRQSDTHTGIKRSLEPDEYANDSHGDGDGDPEPEPKRVAQSPLI